MNQLRLLRTRYGFTQNDIASRLATTQQTVARWETGKVEIPVDRLKELAIIFSCSVDTLLGLERPDEERARTPFAVADRGRPWGTLRLTMEWGQVNYPIDFPTKAQLLAELHSAWGLKAAGEWIEFPTLDNKLVLARPACIRGIHLFSDDDDDMPPCFHPETYKVLTDETPIANCPAEVAIQIEHLQSIGGSAALEQVRYVRAVSNTGKDERYRFDATVALSVAALSMDHDAVKPNTFLLVEEIGSEVSRLVNLSSLALIEAPLEAFLREMSKGGWADRIASARRS